MDAKQIKRFLSPQHWGIALPMVSDIADVPPHMSLTLSLMLAAYAEEIFRRTLTWFIFIMFCIKCIPHFIVPQLLLKCEYHQTRLILVVHEQMERTWLFTLLGKLISNWKWETLDKSAFSLSFHWTILGCIWNVSHEANANFSLLVVLKQECAHEHD